MSLCITISDDKLIYMDPHFCQDTVDVRDIECPLEVRIYWNSEITGHSWFSLFAYLVRNYKY